jgi:hypothetical protein
MRWSWLLGVLLLMPSRAGAQTSVDDGLQAMERGDYAAAAQILTPLAESSAHAQPIAQFLLAMLYSSGLGVVEQNPANSVRACGLFMASAVASNPLSTQALALARLSHRDTPPLKRLCVAAGLYPWRQPAPVTFELEPGWTVRFERGRPIVRQNGTERTAPTSFEGPGVVFPSIEHTRLEIPETSVRRHFLQVFLWMPRMDADEGWALIWYVGEVVGLDVKGVPIGVQQATLVLADQPASIDVHKLARLAVNADGDVEWIITGLQPGRGVVP